MPNDWPTGNEEHEWRRRAEREQYGREGARHRGPREHERSRDGVGGEPPTTPDVELAQSLRPAGVPRDDAQQLRVKARGGADEQRAHEDRSQEEERSQGQEEVEQIIPDDAPGAGGGHVHKHICGDEREWPQDEDGDPDGVEHEE
jgi:hypothetical protein